VAERITVGGRRERGRAKSQLQAADVTTAGTLLAKAAMSLLGCRTNDEVFRVAGDFLGNLCPGAVVILNDVSPDGEHLITRDVVGLDRASLSVAEDLAGFSILDMSSPIDPRFRSAMLRGVLTRVPEGFVEFALSEVPPEIGAQLAEHLGICDVYTIGIADGDSVRGNIHVFTRSPECVVPADIVESFAHECFSVLEGISKTESLARAARYSQELFERAPLGYQSLDENGCFLDVNDAWLETLGYKRDQVIGRWFGDFLAPDFRDSFRERFPIFKEQGQIHSEFEMMHANGTRHFIAFEGRIGYGPDGGFARTHCILTDITERRCAEQLLRESEDKFKYLFEHSVVAISLTTPDGYLRVNQAFLDMVGYTREELDRGTKWQQLTHPEDVPVTEVLIARVISGTIPSARFVKRYVHKDGHTIWADVSTALRRDADGNPLYFMTSIIDITESKLAQMALEKSRDMIVNLTATVPGVVYQYELRPDGSSAFPFATRGMNDIYEVTPEEVREDASLVFTRLHPDDADRVSELIFESARSLDPFRCEFRVVLPRQGLRWRLSHALPQRTEEGGTLWHGVIQDITDFKLAEEELARYREHLEELVAERTRELQEANMALAAATTAKSEFLASMSHELRTPLNSIIGFGTLLEQGVGGPLNDEQLHHIQLVNASGKHLLSLVNDILDLSRIESGKTIVRLESFDARSLVSAALEMVRPMAATKNIELISTSDDKVGSLTSDSRLVNQILANLLSNAVKFTDSGSVTTRAYVDGDHTVFAVSDTGKGIPTDDLPHIMERFYQVSPGISATIEGAGLGLAISARLADMLGATIDVESELGVGSTFTLRVPTEPGSPDE